MTDWLIKGKIRDLEERESVLVCGDDVIWGRVGGTSWVGLLCDDNRKTSKEKKQKRHYFSVLMYLSPPPPLSCLIIISLNSRCIYISHYSVWCLSFNLWPSSTFSSFPSLPIK